jgi:hypothetical protein
MPDSAHNDRDDRDNREYMQRLTRLETLMETSVGNQKDAKDRWHDLNNELQVVNGRFDKLENKIDATNVKTIVEDVVGRVSRIEEWKGKLVVGVQILKYVFYVMGVFFTMSVAFGEKLAKLPIWGLIK